MSLPHTADLCDAYEAELAIATPGFHDYGGVLAFHGPMQTVRVYEGVGAERVLSNKKVREELETPGHGRVLVIDGGGAMDRALLGDNLAALAVDNGWAGIVVNGCIRDSHAIAEMAIGVKALATIPLKTVKKDIGHVGEAVTFAGVEFVPQAYLYADQDGIVVAKGPLT